MIEFDSIVSKFSVKGLSATSFIPIAAELNNTLKKDKLSIELLQDKLKYFKVFVKEKHPDLFSKLNEENNKIDWFIFMLIEINGKLSLQNIGDILNVTRRTVDFNINRYRNNGYIKREGSTKRGKWTIT